MTWLLILQSFFPNTGLSTSQVGPFASEQECRMAGEKAEKELRGQVYFVCVQATK